jgi:hypothetical protein
MVDELSLFLLIAVVVPLAALIGHFIAAYLVAPRRSVAALKAYISSEEFTDVVNARVSPLIDERLSGENITAILDPIIEKNLSGENLSAVLTEKVGPAIGEYVRSEEGRKLGGELATAVSEVVLQGFLSKLEGQAGGAERAGDERGATMLNGVIDFENPYLNGIWTMLDGGTKRKFLRKAYRVMRRGIASEAGMPELAAEASDSQLEGWFKG